MTPRNKSKASRRMDIHEQCNAALEEILEQKLDELATVLSVSGNGKSRLHSDIVDMVEKSLFKIALLNAPAMSKVRRRRPPRHQRNTFSETKWPNWVSIRQKSTAIDCAPRKNSGKACRAL